MTPHYLIAHDSFGALCQWDWSTERPWPRFSKDKYQAIQYETLDIAGANLVKCWTSPRRGMHKCQILHYDGKGYFALAKDGTFTERRGT